MATSDGDRPDVSSRKSDLSLAATLLSLFDFNADGAVTRAEWERGLSTLLLGGLLEDNGLFDQLLERYDTNGTGAVQLNKIRDVLPIDPRISVLMQQLVHSVAGCREYVAAATKKQQRDVEMKSQRAVINLRKRLLSPIFYGWLDAIRADKKVKLKAARFLRNAGLSKAWRTWLDLCDKAAHEARKQKRMGRILKRMQQRGISKALNQWIDVYDERKVRRRTEGPAALCAVLISRIRMQHAHCILPALLSILLLTVGPPRMHSLFCPLSARVRPGTAAAPQAREAGLRWRPQPRMEPVGRSL